MRFGWCTGASEWPRLRDAGFDAVEVGAASTFGDDAPGLPEGVPVVSTNLFLPGGARLTGPDAQDWTPYVARMIRRAADAGVRVMVIGSGGARRTAPGQSVEEAETVFANAVAQWQALATPAGITLAPEPLNHHECDVMVRYPHLGQHMSARGLAVTLDSYHSLAERDPAHTDPLAYWQREVTLMPAHLHLSTTDRLPPVAGDPWLDALASRLKGQGYSGHVMVEAPLPADNAELRRIRQALALWA